MRGIDYNPMSPLTLLRQLLLQTALAGVVWFAIAVMVEKMIPGFISPFVNVPGAALIVMAIGVGAVLLNPPSKTGLSRLPSLIVSVGVVVIMSLFLWARINDLGSSGVALIIVVGLLGGAFCMAHLSKKSIME